MTQKPDRFTKFALAFLGLVLGVAVGATAFLVLRGGHGVGVLVPAALYYAAACGAGRRG